MCWESDYPHSDSSWPNAPEKLWELMRGVDADLVAKISHGNAMQHYQFDPFSLRTPEQCTAGALRAEATDVDTVTHVGRHADASDLEAWRRSQAPRPRRAPEPAPSPVPHSTPATRLAERQDVSTPRRSTSDGSARSSWRTAASQ